MASYLSYPFDPELFLLQWRNWEDPTKTALIDSGAVVQDGTLRNLIANGSDLFTLPFYDTIGGTPDNYDGATDITTTAPTGSSQSGIVFGRAHGWTDKDFIHDFNSGADPMQQITSQVAKYWAKQRQSILIKILSGIFGITDSDGWSNHTTNIALVSSTGSLTDANKVGATTAGDAAQKAVGDNAGIFTMAVMHSKVANNLAGLQLLNFRKYTDSMGIERQLNIADFNGMTVIVDDGVPVTQNSTSKQDEYTTYLLGRGAILTAPAPVSVPVEVYRDPKTAGGQNILYNRIREAIHPNGFTFTPPSASYTKSPTDAQLADKDNWKVAGVPKAIPIARIVSNG